MARKKPEPKWLRAARLANRGGAPVDWISRALGRVGVMPREAAEQAIADGRVTIDGQVAREPLAEVNARSRVEVDGRTVSLVAPTRCLMLHKPAGIVTARSDPEGVGTVFAHLAGVLEPSLRGYEWLAIGRLDRDTTGLLLFTNDERLVAHVASAHSQLPKTYVAEVEGDPTEDLLDELRAGIELSDGRTRPARARRLGAGRVELTITEGRHHQVKRMLEAIGHPVRTLHRSHVAGVALDVGVGQHRELSEQEVHAALRFRLPPRHSSSG